MHQGAQCRLDHYSRNRELLRARHRAYMNRSEIKQRDRESRRARYAYRKERIRAVAEQPNDDPESLFYGVPP